MDRQWHENVDGNLPVLMAHFLMMEEENTVIVLLGKRATKSSRIKIKHFRLLENI